MTIKDIIIAPNGSDTVRRLMMMTDYTQLFVFVLYWLWKKLYDFANFVKQHIVPYEYAGCYRSL